MRQFTNCRIVVPFYDERVTNSWPLWPHVGRSGCRATRVRPSGCCLRLTAGGGQIFHEPAVGVGDALAERDFRAPAEGFDFGDVEEFAGGTVGLACVELQRALKAEDVANRLGELPNGDILAATDIDHVRLVVVLEEEEAGIGQVVGVQKFAARGAAAPHGDGLGSA